MFRLAPTPSGYLHKGNLFSFWLTSELAMQFDQPIFLRIDDLDEERSKDEYLDFIFEALEFYGLNWEEGPSSAREHRVKWSQKYRMPLYNHYLRKLEEQENSFRCNCSRKEIKEAGLLSGCARNCREQNSADNDNAVVRLETSKNKHSIIHFDEDSSELAFDKSVEEFVLVRRDGIPSYQIASLADDVFFGITHIVRGEDLLSSTWAQMELAGLLQEEHFLQTRFLHHPLQSADGEKISKSTGAPALQLSSSERTELKEEYSIWKINNGLDHYLTLSRGSMRA